MCRSLSAFAIVKSRRRKLWTENAPLIWNKRNAYRILLKKFPGKRSLGRPRRRWF
jgi:hypothetical protein